MEEMHLPSSYRGIINDINKLIAEGNKALGKPDEVGTIRPVIFVDELVELYKEVVMTLGEIKGKVMQLEKNNSKNLDKYEIAIDKLKSLEEELSFKLKKIGRSGF